MIHDARVENVWEDSEVDPYVPSLRSIPPAQPF